MASIQQSIQINAAAHAVYQQLMRFEDYPQFMEDVQSVRKTDDTHLHWTSQMADRSVEWDAEITELQSDRCIAWHNISGPGNAGKVEVQELGPDSSQIVFTLDSDPEQVPGSMAGYAEEDLGRRLKQDLARFKDLIEAQGATKSGAQSGAPTSDASKTPGYLAVRDSMGGVYEVHDVQTTQGSGQAARPGDSGQLPKATVAGAPAPAGASAIVGAAGGTDASAGARLSGSKGGPGGPSLREQVDAADVSGTAGGEREGERVSPAAGADAAGGTGLGTAASASDTRTGTSSGSGTALTGGGMSGARDAGTSGTGGAS